MIVNKMYVNNQRCNVFSFVFFFNLIILLASSDLLRAIQKCQHFHECTNSTLLDPLPPSPPSVQTNIFGFQNMGFMQNIYCATTQINPYFKPV